MEVLLPEAVEAALEAIEHGRTDIVKALLDKVKVQNDLPTFLNQELSSHKNKTLLEIAVENDKVDISRTLLREGADPSIKDEAGRSIIDKAGSERMKESFSCEFLQAVAQIEPDLRAIKRFLNGGLKYASTLDDPKTRNNALHWATSFGCKDTVEFLVESDLDSINNSNFEGITPLHEAALRGDSDIINVMLKAGADPNIRIKDGKWSGQLARDLLKDELKDLIPETTPVVNGHSNGESESLDSDEEANKIMPRIKSQYVLPSPSITDERLKLLWPPPQSILEVEGESLIVPSKIPLTIIPGDFSIHEILDVVDHYKEIMYDQTKRCVVLSTEGHPLSSTPSIIHQGLQIVINQQLFHVKGAYKFIISNRGIKLIAGEKEGIQHGLTTFIQLMRLFKVPETENDIVLKPMIINDFPDTSIRGVLLDLNSYGRIPQMKVLMSMIDIWTFMKVNHLHVFIRLSRAKKWQLPYTKINLLSIDRYCRYRGIHFVPAIDIASDINGVEDAREMVNNFNDVISCFDSSKFLHFGPRLTSMISRSSEYFNIFIAPVKKKTLMLCSNSIPPNCITIPSDALLLYYGFEKCIDGFRSNVESLYNQGHSIAFCSGTNAWSSVAGSPSKMMENLFDVQKVCQSLNGIGSINAHWASDPSFNHLVFAWPGYILSSGLGWNPKRINNENVISALEDVLGQFVVQDKDEAKALIELGKIEESLNSNEIVSALLKVFTNLEDDNAFLSKHSLEDFGEMVQNIRRVQMKLLKLKSPNKTVRGIFEPNDNTEKEVKFDGSSAQIRALWSKEVYLSSELLLIGARVGRALLASKVSSEKEASYANLQPTFKTDIANRLLCLIDLYKDAWTSSHVLSGLEGSLFVLTKFFKKLVPE